MMGRVSRVKVKYMEFLVFHGHVGHFTTISGPKQPNQISTNQYLID